MYQLNFENLVSYDAGEAGILVKIEIHFKDISVRFDAKIDTGATACIFERRHGEELGLKIAKGSPQTFSTATDSFRAYGHLVTMVAAGFEFSLTIFFAEDENFRRNILGKRGWLDRVIIGINDYDGKLYLSRYQSL